MMKLAGVLTVVVLAWGLATTTALTQRRWQNYGNKAKCAFWNPNPHANSTATWLGDCVNGKANGFGEEVWRYLVGAKWKEERYTGTMRDGYFNGRGIWVGDGDRYEGGWRNGSKHGHGVYVWADGSRYEGDYKEGKEHGRGVEVWADGSRYEGYYRNGERTGSGVYKFASGKRYKGEFKDGKFSGHGVIVFADGSKCEGDWRNDTLLGTGGGFENGQYKKCHDDGTSIVFSEFSGSELSERSVKVGNIAYANGDKYEGNILVGERHGRGVYVWASGGRYEGGWRNGKQHGRGIKTWASGNRYEGTYRDGKRHGRGVYVYADGDECAGNWREGKLLGKGEGLVNGQHKKCYVNRIEILFSN